MFQGRYVDMHPGRLLCAAWMLFQGVAETEFPHSPSFFPTSDLTLHGIQPSPPPDLLASQSGNPLSSVGIVGSHMWALLPVPESTLCYEQRAGKRVHACPAFLPPSLCFLSSHLKPKSLQHRLVYWLLTSSPRVAVQV